MSILFPGERRRWHTGREFEIIAVERYPDGEQWIIRNSNGDVSMSSCKGQWIVENSYHVDHPHRVQTGERRHWTDRPDSIFTVISRLETSNGVKCSIILDDVTRCGYIHPELYILNESVLITEDNLSRDVSMSSCESDSDSSQFEFFD